ncbi:MAG: homocysteine S-methyltransferase family protein, partial [Anaerolineae bacterium]|nr:homocysteine S-methyltransferase family protein [Anaerolineae bacterium]
MDKNPFVIPFTNRRYLDAVEDHVVVFDGAVGTELAKTHLVAADFGGERTEGLMEMLLFHRPEVVEAAHTAYLQAGAEVLETNSFRANRITLGEFGVGERTLEINRAAAVLARRVADRVQAETGLPRFVAGSMGPTGKLPSLDDPELSDVTFDTLVDVFAEQAQGLIKGGVDLLLIETQQDLLELKAAIHGIWRAFTALGVRLPIQAQMTLDASGHMLSGPDVEAALVAIAALPADVIGMNCSTGPEEMRESVRRLLALTNRPFSVLPNAGMPENVGGRAVYRMDPVSFAGALAEFVRWGVRVVGGCCGTGPAHVTALRATLERDGLIAHRLPERVAAAPLPYAASNIQAVALHQDPRPLLVGERINTQGSKQARELVLGERYDALVELAETQVGYGAHLLDVCLALTERADEPETMRRVVKQLSLNTPAPLMIDTTDPEVMQAALEIYPGRAVINSVHLEGGEARARRIMTLARDFGAALVALTIDETGMAKTVARKLAVARRLYDLAVTEVGLPPHALIFDPLTFTLATGDPETANAAVETLEALRQLKVALPGVLTSLGVSNVSFGLTPPARRSLNSVFLYQAAVAGLDMAIVNPAQITPYPDIPAEVREAADALIFNRDPDALARYLSCFEGAGSAPAEAEVSTALPAHEQLFQAILHRRREGVEALVEGSLEHFAPLAVLNEILLPAMKEVGDRFGSGELILPFVLKSAEVMRAAVGHLEQYLDRVVGTSRGTVVLATVFGDVHDIGKNLVKTVLVNNGYTVHDLGKQVPVEAVIDKAVEVHADAIGLSALLVATSQQMKLAVESLQRRGLAIPVLIGGAAINPSFAERIALDAEGRPYAGGVHYCKDAFAALTVLGELGRRPQPEMSGSSTAIPAQLVPEADLEPDSSDAAVYAWSCCTPAAPSLRPSAQIPVPPFW